MHLSLHPIAPAAGGTAAYTWSLLSGALPAGLTLSADGVISGMPTAQTGATSLTFGVSDSGVNTQTATAALSFGIGMGQPFTISTTALASGRIGTAYSQPLGASGGAAPYNWAITAGALPPGLVLTSNTISGTPSAAGAFQFTVQATDGETPAQSASQSYTIAIGSGVKEYIRLGGRVIAIEQ
jgi:hypothetical protein